MAYEASIVKEAMRFADAIHGYAQSKGWERDSYHIFIIANTDYYTLRILVVASAFDRRTERQEYEDFDDIVDFLDAEIKPNDHNLNSYSLVLRGMDDFASYHSPTLGPSEVEIDEKLINHGVSWSEPFRRKN